MGKGKKHKQEGESGAGAGVGANADAAQIAMMGAFDEAEMEEDEDAWEAGAGGSDAGSSSGSYDDEDEEEDYSEEEEEGGKGEGAGAGGAAEAGGGGVKRKRGRGDAKFAPPTEEEARHLRETEDLFKSNLLRMEITELLSEVRVEGAGPGAPSPSKRQRALQGFLFALRDLLLGLPKGEMPETPENTQAFPFTPHAQWGDVKAQGKGRLAFAPPKGVEVVGSFMLPGAICKPDPLVDVTMEMPPATFGPKWPFLNHRYHNRRNAYLAHVAALLGDSRVNKGLIKSIEVVPFQGDRARPALVLEPAAHTGGVRVRLLPAVTFSEGGPTSAELKRRKKEKREQGRKGKEQADEEEEDDEEEGSLLDRRKLNPRRSNVRRQIYTNGSTGSGSGGSEPPTPHYSQGILLEGSHKAHLAMLHAALGCGTEGLGKGVRDALVLLKVWIAQREALAAPDSLSGFALACLAAYLLQERRLNLRMDALPALMVTLKFLADASLLATGDNPLLLQGKSTVDLTAYTGAFPCALIVGDTGCNALGGLSRAAAEEVHREARAALALLQSNARDACPALFLTRLPFFRAYDFYVQLPLASGVKLGASGDDPVATATAKEEEVATCDLPLGQYVARKAHQVLTRALGDRARRVRSLHRPRRVTLFGTPPSSSSNDHAGEDGDSYEAVWVGVAVDPQHALRLVDRGPPADDAVKAREFRAFWGPRAELRRFKDGAIVEAVVWSTGDVPRHRIVEEIMRHALGHHLRHRFAGDTKGGKGGKARGGGGGGVRVVGNDLDALLDLSSAAGSSGAGGSMEPEALTKGALTALDALTEKLKGVKGLPLELQIVEPLSPSLRHTSLFPPLPHPLVHGSGRHVKTLEGQQVSSSIEPLPIQLRFEKSSKWPDSLAAIRSAQAAFLIQLQHGLERDAEVKATLAGANALDLMLEGYAFRASIALPKEVTLLEEAWAAAKAGKLDPREKAVLPPQEEVEALSRRVAREGVHHRLVQACHANNPLYGRVVRLAQIWAANHYLHPAAHLPLEAIELMAAWLFARPLPFQPPGSVLNGLVAFLSLLATHDWAGTPLVVDPHGQMTPDDHEAARKAFEAQRGEGGGHGGAALFIVAPYDRERGWLPSWTDAATPERVVLARAAALAQASLHALLHWVKYGGDEEDEEGWKAAVAPAPLSRLGAGELGVVGGFDVVVKFRSEWVGPLLSGPYEAGGKALEEARKGCKALRCAKLYKNLAGAQAQKRVLGFDPVAQYYARVLHLYGRHLALPPFMSPLHRDAMALTFRPRAFLPASFAVLQTRACIAVKPEAEGGEGEGSSSSSSAAFVLPNIAEVLSDLKALGEGIVEEVVVVGC